MGYHGRDVDAMIRDLLEFSIRIIRSEFAEKIKEEVDRQTEERLLDCLLPSTPRSGETDEERSARLDRTRGKLAEQLRSGSLEDNLVDITVEEKSHSDGHVYAYGTGTDGFGVPRHAR